MIPDAPPDWQRPVKHAEPLDKTTIPGKFTAKLAGVSFHPDYPERLLYLPPDSPLELAREPENEHDPNAVAVVFLLAQKGREAIVDVLGHLPRALAARIAPEMDAGRTWAISGHEVLVKEGYEDRPGLSVRLERS
jgi:hypothetical protein